MTDLDKIARNCRACVSDTTRLHSAKLDTSTALEILGYFSGRYRRGLVLYGGQLATPLFWGFKQMRKLTNDFDFVVSEPILVEMIGSEGLSYNPEYHIFFTYLDGIICCFTSGSIHGWDIPEDFFTMAAEFKIQGREISVCSREYTVALKFRRAVAGGGDLFGKDAIDIINIVSAPAFRKDLPPLDFGRTASIVLAHAGSGAVSLYSSLFEHLNHVPAPSQDTAMRELTRLFLLLRERAS